MEIGLSLLPGPHSGMHFLRTSGCVPPWQHLKPVLQGMAVCSIDIFSCRFDSAIYIIFLLYHFIVSAVPFTSHNLMFYLNVVSRLYNYYIFYCFVLLLLLLLLLLLYSLLVLLSLSSSSSLSLMTWRRGAKNFIKIHIFKCILSGEREIPRPLHGIWHLTLVFHPILPNNPSDHLI